VDDATAYFAAGIANYDGTYVYAVDPATGYVRWCNDTSGHLDPAAQVGVSAQGHLLAKAGKLYLAGGNAVSPAVYDQRDGNCLNDPGPLAACQSTSPRGWELFAVGDRVIACGRPYYAHPDMEVYDHTVTNKILHARTGERDIVWLDNTTLMCFDNLDTAALNRCVTDEKIPRHVTQAWGEFKVDEKPHWGFTTPQATALAAARNAVVVATDTGVVAVDIRSGKPLWTQNLPAPVVPWGLAVSRHGRILVSLTDGRVVCVGAKSQ
jgi:outer membrane protein assembly factor BamB